MDGKFTLLNGYFFFRFLRHLLRKIQRKNNIIQWWWCKSIFLVSRLNYIWVFFLYFILFGMWSKSPYFNFFLCYTFIPKSDIWKKHGCKTKCKNPRYPFQPEPPYFFPVLKTINMWWGDGFFKFKKKLKHKTWSLKYIFFLWNTKVLCTRYDGRKIKMGNIFWILKCLKNKSRDCCFVELTCMMHLRCSFFILQSFRLADTQIYASCL